MNIIRSWWCGSNLKSGLAGLLNNGCPCCCSQTMIPIVLCLSEQLSLKEMQTEVQEKEQFVWKFSFPYYICQINLHQTQENHFMWIWCCWFIRWICSEGSCLDKKEIIWKNYCMFPILLTPYLSKISMNFCPIKGNI